MNLESFLDQLIGDILANEGHLSSKAPDRKFRESLDASQLQGERNMVWLSVQLAPKRFTTGNVKAYQQKRRSPKKSGNFPSPRPFPVDEVPLSVGTEWKIERKMGVEELLCLRKIQILGAAELDEGSRHEEFKTEFRRLAKKYHPDFFTAPGEKQKASETFQELAFCFKKLLQFTILDTRRS